MDTLDLIVLAAGAGTRSGVPVAKQFLDLSGKPVIVRALSEFEKLPYIGTKYVAVHRTDIEFADSLLRKHNITGFELVPGGETRQESVRLALNCVRTKRVITHNAALPFVTSELIENVAREDYPCVTTVTAVQTHLCRGDEFAEQIVPIEHLKLINTPQSFDTELFREAHRRASRDGLIFKTDCELMMHYGHRVKFVPGIAENFKITTHLDVILARSIASSQVADTQPTMPPDLERNTNREAGNIKEMKAASLQWTTDSLGRRIPSGSLYNRFILRQISVYLTWVFVRFGIRAQTGTLLMTVAGIAGVAAGIPHSLLWSVFAGVCFVLFDILDAVDGDVARWTHTSTTRGLYMDQISHVFVDYPSRGVAALHIYAMTSETLYLALGIVAIFCPVLGRTLREICLRINSSQSALASKQDPVHPESHGMKSTGRLAACFAAVKKTPLLMFPVTKARLVHIAVVIGILLSYRGSPGFLFFLSWFYAVYSALYLMFEIPFYCFVRVINVPHVKPVHHYKWPI
ncbi:MAG: 2-C-methyl-D-erythritol 4-phosphate cytidylyltransferase [Planctomycetales bacterium]|nr:2-C-methyl-D-erythritol 4-phosphate cytidylyltransferase [Planctomycetales bacterium]